MGELIFKFSLNFIPSFLHTDFKYSKIPISIRIKSSSVLLSIYLDLFNLSISKL